MSANRTMLPVKVRQCVSVNEMCVCVLGCSSMIPSSRQIKVQLMAFLRFTLLSDCIKLRWNRDQKSTRGGAADMFTEEMIEMITDLCFLRSEFSSMDQSEDREEGVLPSKTTQRWEDHLYLSMILLYVSAQLQHSDFIHRNKPELDPKLEPESEPEPNPLKSNMSKDPPITFNQNASSNKQ